VILTTHSPYLLDLVNPEQVKVFSKQQDGTVEARTMSDHQEVRDMTKHFMSGTIWTELGEERIIEGAKGE
jgi:predicted ATP-binding protein involved in virulence